MGEFSSIHWLIALFLVGGIFTHEWLVGYWLGWIGLLGPMFVAIFRPKERTPEEVNNG